MTEAPEYLSDPPMGQAGSGADPLAGMLQALGLTGGVFLEAEFSAPWCIVARVTPEDCGPLQPLPDRIIAYHYVVEGKLLLELEGEAAITANAGDIILLPRNDRHRLGSTLNAKATDITPLIRPAAAGHPARVEFGGGGDRTHLLCGFLGSNADRNPLLAMLPPVLALTVETGISRDWIAQSFRFGASELRQGSPGILARLAETLFLAAIRQYLDNLPASRKGWLAGLRDCQVGKALALMHDRLSHRWTTAELAGAVGLSRSAFAQRFRSLIGVPPMTYLTHWRLQVAADRLGDSRQSIAQIAEAVGYESESALYRVFRRKFGMPPATWRHRYNKTGMSDGD